MIDWPEDTTFASPAQCAILRRRLRQTVAELEEMGVTVPAGLAALADDGPDTEDDANDPVGMPPR